MRSPTFPVKGDKTVPQSGGLLTSLPSPVPARTQRVMGPGGGRAVQQPEPGVALPNMETEQGDVSHVAAVEAAERAATLQLVRKV